ncbi:hypothetical protein [Streptomyces cylindrosporus]|uniref:Uncharacterized protein n=1 Tax=Streptomyces cylindrosporus TaxID=2927583 RepID=A0ABS9YI05_9ACTN|nr:hypothetical protein [Streptomyces cylindrosporus]MCI3276883.1 hypothetical protein [Streptomyces cylindrosporus]
MNRHRASSLVSPHTVGSAAALLGAVLLLTRLTPARRALAPLAAPAYSFR